MRVLRQRNFTSVWLGGLISDTGDWLLIVGMPLYVFELTRSAMATALVFIIELAPSALGSFAGVLVDRWDRRRTLITIMLMQAALLLPLLAVRTVDQIWIVYVVAVLEAILVQLFIPAKNALVPTLVADADLAGANSLTAGGSALARLVGSPLGGAVVEFSGLTGIVVADAASFVLAAVLFALLRPAAGAGTQTTGEHARVGARSRFLGEWWDGIRRIGADAQLRGLLAVLGLASIAQGLFSVLFIIFVERELAGSATHVGLLRGVQALGGVVAAITIAVVGSRISAKALLVFGLSGLGVLALAAWNAPVLTTHLGLYIALMAAAGVPATAYGTGLLTCGQRNVEDRYRGRVLAAFATIGGLTEAIGLTIGGLLGDRVGVVAVLNGQATLYLLGALIAVTLLRGRSTGGAAPEPAEPSPAASVPSLRPQG